MQKFKKNIQICNGTRTFSYNNYHSYKNEAIFPDIYCTFVFFFWSNYKKIIYKYIIDLFLGNTDIPRTKIRTLWFTKNSWRFQKKWAKLIPKSFFRAIDSDDRTASENWKQNRLGYLSSTVFFRKDILFQCKNISILIGIFF